jgi:hypothetical protein
LHLPDEDLSNEEYLAILRNTIALGEESESFFKSEVGRYVVARAKEQVEAATHTLKTVDSTDQRKIIEAQMAIQVPEMLINWLNDAILQKDEIYRQQQSEDDMELDTEPAQET